MQSTATATRRPGIPATTHVLALLCAMYFINYIVRVNVSTAAAVFQPELHLTNTQVGLIFSAFAYPYLAFQIAGGWVADKFGARRALTVFAVLWSSATVLMGLANSLGGKVAVEYAVRHPDEVARLVLLSIVGSDPTFAIVGM